MKIATRDDWNIKEMPEKRDAFTLEREFTKEQIVSASAWQYPPRNDAYTEVVM